MLLVLLCFVVSQSVLPRLHTVPWLAPLAPCQGLFDMGFFDMASWIKCPILNEKNIWDDNHHKLGYNPHKFGIIGI